MKKTLLALFAGFAFTAASAQTSGLQPQNPPAVVMGGYTQVLHASFPVMNTTSQPMDVKVSRKIISEVTGSENNFCWGINCYPPNVSVSPDAETIAGGASNSSFIADYTPNNMPGNTTIRYSFFKEFGATDSAHVTIRFEANTAMSTRGGADANSVSISQPKPNPATDITAIEYSLPANARNAKLRLYNAIGGQIREVAITQRQGAIIINTSGLPSGIYFYTLQVDNRSVATKKLVVRH